MESIQLRARERKINSSFSWEDDGAYFHKSQAIHENECLSCCH